jgi:uncharacterized membrane protein YfcA
METTQTSVAASVNKTKRAVRGLAIGLVVEFLLGVLLVTVADTNDQATQQSLAHNVILGLHVLIAVGLLVGSIAQALPKQEAWRRRRLMLAAGCIIGAFLGGVWAVSLPGADWGVLVMALGFMAALLVYNQLLHKLGQQER